MQHATSAPGTWFVPASETTNFLPPDVQSDMRIVAQVTSMARAFVNEAEKRLARMNDKTRRLVCRSAVQSLAFDLPFMEDEPHAIECEWWEGQ
ncbi:hypothetical protein AAJCM20276_27500 [Acetobacter aceti]|uniref:Uncharacterized protein n=1 Tax=Acetobacter aceti TaxID=435 RepID=A0A6S6PMZ0_ACEAC|nr:hypothetical protein [Acetobacter aceti]BCI68126.1 hypothetical protein AAJCM20276_27500 [Acetobacter aceti]